MAISVSTVWEVRQAGNDTNGGGFVAGATGTDYSQQNSAQYALTNGTTNGTTTILTSSASADMVGNIAFISGGTGSITSAWYQIISVSVGVSMVVDRLTGLTAGTGVTINIGGAFATIGTATAIMASTGNIIWVKSGGVTPYQISANFTFSVAGTTPSTTVNWNKIIGYNTSRGDGYTASTGTITGPTVQLITNTGLTAFPIPNGFWLENIIIDCNNLGTSSGIVVSGSYHRILHCKVMNFTSVGINLGATTASQVIENEITGGTSAATFALSATASLQAEGNYIHNNACSGLSVSGAANGICVINNIIANNTGANSDGIFLGFNTLAFNNVIYGNGRDGIRMADVDDIGKIIKNNILVNNAGFGINNSSGSLPASYYYDGNAFFNNTSGALNGMNNVSGINAVNPYTYTKNVTLTGSPFTNAASGNFSLNSTAGAGASVRASGFPGVFPVGLTTGFIDMGAAQHQASSGSGGIILNTGMNGGF